MGCGFNDGSFDFSFANVPNTHLLKDIILGYLYELSGLTANVSPTPVENTIEIVKKWHQIRFTHR